MKPLSRKTAAAVVSAALATGSWPRAAFANPQPLPAAAQDQPDESGLDPKTVLARLQQWGVFKGNDDALRTYMGDATHLTPLGRSLYLTLIKSHDPKLEQRAIVEEVDGLRPALDRLRDIGPLDAARTKGMNDALTALNKQLGSIASAPDGSVEGEFRMGAQMNALITGAAVVDPPKASDYTAVRVADGVEMWDGEGVAFRYNSKNAIIYNRNLQKIQHQMNLARPAGVDFIPETGRYNTQMFDFSYRSIKDQYDALVEQQRRDRVIALADLLGALNRFRDDMWFTDKRIEADLEAEARAKVYHHRGQDYNLLDLVNDKFKQRQYYLDQAKIGVERYDKDANALKAYLKSSGAITDAQVRSLQLDEQYTRRFNNLAVLETLKYSVKNQLEHLDPSSPDSAQIMKALDSAGLTPDQKAQYKLRAREMTARLQALINMLEKTRGALSATDYATNLDSAAATLAASQRELQLVSTDASLYAQAPILSYAGRQQTDVSWLDFGSKLTRAGWRLVSSDYRANMRAIEANTPKYDAISKMIAAGNLAGARQAMIAVDPHALREQFAAPLNGAAPKITDMSRLAGSMKAGQDRVASVFSTNEMLDTAGRFVTFAVEMAIAAPLVRAGSSWWAGRLARYTGEAAAGETASLARFAVVRRSAIILRETLLHVEARLGSLEPDAARINAMASNAVTRQLLATAVRTGSVAWRQAAFTATSGVLSGVFQAGSHYWDKATESMMGPGQSATVNLPLVGEVGVRPGDSMFDNGWDAFSTGFRGGVVWANKPMEVFGIPLIHPGLLGYVNIPSTVFRGTALMRYAELVGTRGAVGTAFGSAKYLFGGEAAVAEGAASRGFLESLAEKGVLGKSTAFGLSMADNVAKYVLFSDALSWAGNKYAYNVGSINLPLVGDVGGHADEPDVERRIKFANAEGQKMLASPAWMLIPGYAAHQARDAAPYMRAMEGAKQYDEAGRTGDYVNKEVGARIDFIEKPQTPLSQRFFEMRFMEPPAEDFWILTDQIKREGIKREMLRMTGGDKATAADVNPLKFYRATKLEDGADYINLKVNDEVRLVAHQDFVESLLADPKRAARVLDAVPGSEVEGFGRVTPEIKKDVAVALYSSEMQVGKPMPKELAGKVGEILKPYLDANNSVRPASERFANALNEAPVKSEALDNAIADANKKVADWHAAPNGRSYMEVVGEIRADAEASKLAPKEKAVMTAWADYIGAIEERFNAFNTVGQTRKLAGEGLDALKVQYRGNSAVEATLDRFQTSLDEWVGRHSADQAADGPRSDGSFKSLMNQLNRDLEKSKAALGDDFGAMKQALKDMEASPWVLHDSKGTALSSWRPDQFKSLMGALGEMSTTGRGGEAPQIFQMLKTGGGKTMLTFEGLLPLVEADAAKRGLKPMFLTVQSNLEAQARMEFLAFKKIGSTLEFDTYEGFKTKIAEGKTKGKNALRDYWILGDEMDGAALQPALTIGQVTGSIAKRSPLYNRIDDMDQTLGRSLGNDAAARDSSVLTDARRALDEITGMSGAGKSELAQATQLVEAAGKLKEVSGASRRAALEAEIRARAAKLDEALGHLPMSDADAIAPARKALRELTGVLDGGAGGAAKPTGLAALKNLLFSKSDAAAHGDLVAGLEAGFAREENLLRLTGSEAGLRRLAVEAEAKASQLDLKVRRLATDLEAARREPKPDALKIKGLSEDLSTARAELELVERFRSEDAGLRLTGLQDRIAEAEHGGTGADQLAGWKKRATELEGGLGDEGKALAKARAEALNKIYEIGREANKVDEEIAQAARRGETADALTARRASLEADYATARAEIERLKTDMTGGASSGDLGGMMRRLDVLAAREKVLLSKIADAKARGTRAGPETSELSSVRSERKALLETAQAEVRTRLARAADDVVALAKGRKPGWEDPARRLLERRREMMEAFAGDENPMYSAFRGMHDDMQAFALNEALKNPDPTVWKPAAQRLMKLVEGQSTLKFLPKLPKLLWEVFSGREVDIPVDEVGLTRLHAAKLLKSLFADPTMPVHQRDALMWSLLDSVISPGTKGRSSWVRTELLRQLQGFFEDPAGIRLDSRTGRINVVHNGQWFESMDNESRRFWELEYGTDLTLPYTNQSISTIKDVTTDKKARFISFSGTAGEKLREHFRQNEISIVGEGSKPPAVVDLDLMTGPSDRITRAGLGLAELNSGRGKVVVESLEGASPEARRQIEEKLGGPLTKPRALTMSDFAGQAEAMKFLTEVRSRQGDADHLVIRRLQDLPRVPDEAATTLRAYLKSGALSGDARAGLEGVLDLEAVTPAQKAALEEAMKSWTGPLEEARGSVESMLASNVSKEVRQLVEAHLKKVGLSGKDEAVVSIKAIADEAGPAGEAARAWLKSLRSNQGDTGLLVLSVSDTRVLKVVREYLMRVQGLKADEIAMVFSDTEYLRNNVPEADVKKQMNLDALNNGKARVLILDTRVGGRGLDLNFKGERSLSPKSFRGYTSFEMLIVDPQKMSSVHLLQAEGRIDEGRVLPGAGDKRKFSLVMDIQSVAGEEVFRKMIAEDPFFQKDILGNPKFEDFMKARGGKPDWAAIDAFVRAQEATGSPDGALLAEQYETAVKKHLDIQQSEVEENQLSQSSVLQQPARTGGRFPGVSEMR